jgi:ribose/xylose/arabinose/galactoside ABC-type transport system permease subunit
MPNTRALTIDTLCVNQMGWTVAFLVAGGFIVITLMMFIVLVGLPLYCIIDAATRSSDEFAKADSNKTLWIVLPFVFGIVAAIVYLAAIRPKLKLVTR